MDLNKSPQIVSNYKDEAPDLSEEAVSDLEFIRRHQTGDVTAFGNLVAKYQKKVFSVALSIAKNPEDAMDIAQDTFIKAHRYLGGFQGSSSFYTWLYRITVNLSIDHLRRTGKRVNVDFDERIGRKSQEPEGSAFLANRHDIDPSRVLSRKELAGKIRSAVEELPPYHRAVIIMREIDGMSYEEIAKAMRISKGTVMSRLHHARQKLQRSLEGYLKGDLSLE